MVGSDPAFSPERPEGHTHQDPRLLCFTLGNPDSMATETVGPKNTDLNFSSQAKGQGHEAMHHVWRPEPSTAPGWQSVPSQWGMGVNLCVQTGISQASRSASEPASSLNKADSLHLSFWGHMRTNGTQPGPDMSRSPGLPTIPLQKAQ